jgi:hypothetical protein
MRKHLTLLLLSTTSLCLTQLSAQNWVNGGNILSANGTLGTNSSHSLLFETSGAERGRITNGGNWGIGTASPLSKLAVNSASGASPFRASIAGVHKFIVNSNGGVTIGSSTAGPANGLYIAGNVGIGTSAPSTKLHVVGNTYITGNVGIGTTSPVAKLHVNGGSQTGIYATANYIALYGVSDYSSGVYGSSSSGYGVEGYSSSSIGVYGQSGASFSAGMYATSPYIGLQGVSSGSDGGRQAIRGENNRSSTGYAGFFNGNVWVYGTLIKNAGSFKIDHPLDPANKFLSHSFVESPDMKNIYDGVVTTDQSGKATVILPDYFEALNKEFRYQLTPIGKRFAKAIIIKEISNNQFEIQTNKKAVKVAWQVTGTRKDAYAEMHRIPVEEPKKGNEIGKYLFPEGFGKPGSEILDIAKPGGGIHTTPRDTALYAGSFSDNVSTSGSYLPSDRQLKQNISDLTAALPLINKLQPKEFEFRQDGHYKDMNLPKGKQYGLIAQDLELVLPDLIKQNEFNTAGAAPAGVSPKEPVPTLKVAKEEKPEVINFKAVNYTELIPILVKALQELSKENEELKRKVADVEELKKQVAELKALWTKNSNNTSVNLLSAFLEESSPNPARGTTTIRYSVPEGTTSAKLTLTNSKGQTLKEVSLTGRGTGHVNLNTAALPAGLYTYALWIDGIKSTSKQLVIAR